MLYNECMYSPPVGNNRFDAKSYATCCLNKCIITNPFSVAVHGRCILVIKTFSNAVHSRASSPRIKKPLLCKCTCLKANAVHIESLLPYIERLLLTSPQQAQPLGITSCPTFSLECFWMAALVATSGYREEIVLYSSQLRLPCSLACFPLCLLFICSLDILSCSL